MVGCLVPAGNVGGCGMGCLLNLGVSALLIAPGFWILAWTSVRLVTRLASGSVLAPSSVQPEVSLP